MSIRKTRSNSTRRCAQGFTLVELLVVISIIGIMSGMFVVAYRGAQQESNSQKTRLTVQKISDVITSRMQDYESYNVPVGIPANATPLAGPAALIGRQKLIERAKLLMLREIIRTEMPDHPDDLKASTLYTYPSTTIIHSNFTGLTSNGIPVSVPAAPLAGINLTSRAAGIWNRLRVAPNWDYSNANAELLYLIIEDSELDGSSAIELFGASEVADTDNDGLNEIIDAFGRPIQWIRWPSGYPQVGRSYPDMLDANIIDADRNVLVDADPFDRIKADPGWFPLDSTVKPGVYPMPLVVSAGQDGLFGLNFREYNPDRAGGLRPRWPTGMASYSVGDLPFPVQQYGNTVLRFSDPWGPRPNPSANATVRNETIGMRMGSFLVPGTDPREGGATAAASVPQIVASDNITNYEGATASL